MFTNSNLTPALIDSINAFYKDKILFVAYNAGRPPSPRAIEEAAVAKEAGLNLTHYVGRFESLRVTKRGDLLLTLFVFDRGVQGEGKFRAFNPNLGRLRNVSVIE